MSDIVITEFMDRSAVDSLAGSYRVVYDPALVDDGERLVSLLPDARALVVRNRTRVDEALLDAAPALEVVGRLGVGLDNIDLAACARRGVQVCPASGANDVAVAEYVIAAAMLLIRPVYLRSGEVVAGSWPRSAGIGGELNGRILGLVGFGGIARETAYRARAFGMAVATFDPYLADGVDLAGARRLDTLDQLLADADVVSIHVPLTDETRGLIGAAELGRVKRGAVLVNTARGGVVDEAALAEALVAGEIAGAALDVFEHEPLAGEAARRFEGVPNLLLTPHVAGVTNESNVRVSRVTADNVRRVLDRSRR